MTHDEARELAPAFVLGALEADEERAVRDHLATCTESHDEFGDLGSAVQALAETVVPVEPPAALRSRIMAAAALDLAERGAVAMAERTSPSTVAERAASTAEHTAPTAERTAPTAEHTAPGVAAAPVAERIVDLAAARSVRRPSGLGWIVGLAAVIAIVALGAWNLSLRSDLDSATAYRQQVDAALAAAAQPSSSTAILSSKDDPARSGLAVVAADGTVHVVVTGLSPTSGDQVYEAWVIAGSTPKPIGSFTVGTGGTGYLVATTAGGQAGDTVALTLEPAPGATAPTLPIIAAGVAGS